MAVDFTVHSDDTVDASVVIALSDDLATLAGMTPDELWDYAGEDLTDEMPPGMSTERYSDGGFTGTRMRMARAPIADAEILDDGMRLTRVGDEFVFEGEMDMDTSELEGLPVNIIDQMDIRVSITFPGPVTEHNGTLSGNTVTWTPAPGDIAVMYARGSAIDGAAGPGDDGGVGPGTDDDGSDLDGGIGGPDAEEATGSGGVNPLIWVAIGLAILALIGIIAALVLKGKNNQPAPYPGGYPAPVAQPGYPAAPAAPVQPGYPAGPQTDAYGRPINPATGQAYAQPGYPAAPVTPAQPASGVVPQVGYAPPVAVDPSTLPAPAAPTVQAPVDPSTLPAPVAPAAVEAAIEAPVEASAEVTQIAEDVEAKAADVIESAEAAVEEAAE
jgi:hypothetical protein